MHQSARRQLLVLLAIAGIPAIAQAGSTPWVFGGNFTSATTQRLGTLDNSPLIMIADGYDGMLLRHERINTKAISGDGVSVMGGFVAAHYIEPQALGATVFGGFFDSVNETNAGNRAYDLGCTVSGGAYNTAGTGDEDPVVDVFCTVSGGSGNLAERAGSTVSGGSSNRAAGTYSVVGGGRNNLVEPEGGAIAGGMDNFVSARFGTVGGGVENIVEGEYATIPGGRNNYAGGDYSFAAGYGAIVSTATKTGPAHHGTFVWSDRSDLINSFQSTGQNQFLVRATGGVGINTNRPRAALDVTLDSTPSRPQLTLTELGADYSRVNFRNTATTRAFALAANSAATTQAGDRFNFFHNLAGNILTLTGDGRVGVGTSNPGLFKLDVNGAVRCTSLTQTSSGRYKTDVTPVGNVLDRFTKLQAVEFTWDADHGGERDLGLIAEDVGAIFPEAVVKNADGQTEGINYSRLTALAVQAVKETRAENAELRALTKQLADRLEKLEARQ
jgi:hypothetical protein